MKNHRLKVLVPGLVAAAALALAVGVGAQTTPPSGSAPAGKTPAAPMASHHKHHMAGGQHEADMQAECEAMLAKHHALQAKLEAMDTELDKLVAEMNAAKGDALEKHVVAVINELVAQRKASRALMTEMQPEMMAHMMHHRDMHGTKDSMKCPLKMGNAPEPKAEQKKP
jgi:hypothetical protein